MIQSANKRQARSLSRAAAILLAALSLLLPQSSTAATGAFTTKADSAAGTVSVPAAAEPVGSISGRVYQADGITPLAGSTIVAGGIENSYYTYRSTEPDGSYTVPGLPPGNYYVTAEASGYILKYFGGGYTKADAIPVAVNAAGDTPNIDFVLDKGGSISGHVYQMDGVTPLSKATMYAFNIDYHNAQGASTDFDGSYRIDLLMPGKYAVCAYAAGYIPIFYERAHEYASASPVTVTGLNDTPGVDFVMDTGGSISGHVFQAEGVTPIVGASVQAVPLDGISTGGQAVTGADGSYSIPGLFSGNYRVAAYAAGHVSQYFNGTYHSNDATPVGVVVHTDTPGIDFTLSTGGSISGHVYQSDGFTPIANISVSATLETGDDKYYGTASTATDGSYTIRTLTSGYYSIRVYNPNYLNEYYNGTYNYSLATLVLVTDLNDTPGIDFNLDTGGSVSGQVYRAVGGVPISGADVAAVLIGQDQSYTQSTPSSSDGKYILSGLMPGKYQVQVHAAGYISQTYGGTYDNKTFTLVPVYLNHETTNNDFALDTGGSISGHVYEADGVTPIQGADVYATASEDTLGGSAHTGPDGSYAIGTLPTGSYFIRAQSTDYPAKYYDGVFGKNAATPVTVTAPNNTPDIDINLATGGTISGHVYRSDGITVLSNASVSAWPVRISSGEAIGIQYFKVLPDTGSYTITGLAPGDYEVSAQAQGYIKEYNGGVYTSSNATLVTVSISADTAGIDFNLDIGGSISGHVYQADGITPIANATVGIPIADIGTITTSSDGSYTIKGLAPGSYNVFANASGYLSEYFDGVYYSGDVTQVNVIAQDDTPGINFILDRGGSISGHIRGVDGGTPLSSVFHVIVEAQEMGTRPPVVPSIAPYPRPTVGGSFKIEDLPPGDYKIFAIASGYVTEYYDGTYSAGTARLVHVTLGNDTPNIDFALEIIGDANNDGLVTMADVTKVERVILMLDPQTGGCDANSDGLIAMGDVTTIERLILGLDP